MKEIIIQSIVNVDDDFEHLKEHELWEEVISEARQIFYDKNHDYCSSWRMEDVSSITREIGQRVVRVLRGLELQESGKDFKSSEGIYSEFRDMINWCVFAMLILKGYGWSPKNLILGAIEKEEQRCIENVTAKAITDMNKLSLSISNSPYNIYAQKAQEENYNISSENIQDAMRELSEKINPDSNNIVIPMDHILSNLNEIVINNFLYKKASTFTMEDWRADPGLAKYNYSEEKLKELVKSFTNKIKDLEEERQILYMRYKKL